MAVPQHFRWPLSFGTIGALFLAAIAVPMGEIYFIQFSSASPALGIYISVLAPAALNQSRVSEPPVPVVRVENPTRWYLNGDQLLPTELPAALKNVLKTRPDWTVYVVANPNVEFRDVVAAMDVIRGEHARIVLLTARLKTSDHSIPK